MGRLWIRHAWEVVSSGFWFVPGLMLVGSMVGALVMVGVDHHIWPMELEWLPQERLFLGSAEGARSMLSTIAGTVITVAGVVFSVTIAAMSQASSQFGPRLLRNFMRDTSNQVVLGMFIATHVYCLVVLRMVRGHVTEGGKVEEFIPHLSITGAMLLSFSSLGVLVYFIHHISSSIRAPEVTMAVARELRSALERPFPGGIGRGDSDLSSEDDECPEGCQRYELRLCKGGYVQAVDGERLMDMAGRAGAVVSLSRRPGEFVPRNGVVGAYYCRSGGRDEELEREFNKVYILGSESTSEQNPEYPIHQLVEIAVRALSPGVNDPFTAMNCLDLLGEALGEAAGMSFPSARRLDDQGRLRVVAHGQTFAGLVEAAMNPIRQSAGLNVAVLLHMIEVLSEIMRKIERPARRKVLEMQLYKIERLVSELSDAGDRADARRRIERFNEIRNHTAENGAPTSATTTANE